MIRISGLVRTELLLAVCFALASLSSPLARAADLAAGQAKAKEICAACHGQDGNTPADPSYPKLSGQHRDYLEHTLLDYKNDKRKHAIMGAMAKGLSRADIENLAAYFASMPGQLMVRH